MKAKAKNKSTKRTSQRNSTKNRRTPEPRKSIEDRDLNEDEQDQITNVGNDHPAPETSTASNNARDTGFTVEEEEEREKRRKVEDIRPEEPMK